MEKRKFHQQSIHKADMFGKEICEGHIVAVRYVWNSYAAPVMYLKGRFVLMVTTSFDGHPFDDNGTYQIIGHWDKDHPDYNEDVKNWIVNKQEGNCPVKISVYDNLPAFPTN